MPFFLQQVACWLWVAITNHVYAPRTFLFFIIIGVAQAGIGLLGVEIGVKALPDEAASAKLRKVYLVIGRVCALLLLPSTLFIGVANDNSQRDADDKAVKAQDNEATTHHQLTDLASFARRSEETTQRLLGSLDPAKLTPNQRIRYKEAQRASAQVAEAVSRPAPTISSPILPNLAVRPLSEFDALMTDKANLLSDIEQTQSKLDVISEEFRRSKEQAFSPIIMQLRQGRSPQDITAPYYSGAIRAALKNREASFQKLRPEIEKKRLEAIILLKLSPSEVSSDNTKFNNAISDSLQEVSVPNNWADIHISPVFSQMNNYLRDLHQRVSEAQ